jgi:hypothetical protein
LFRSYHAYDARRYSREGNRLMDAAMRSNDAPLDLFFATTAVPIPNDHPAYTGPSKALPSRAARRWSVLVATIVGLLSVAAISSGVAHYVLETAAPASEAASASPAMTAAIPAAQPTTPAAEPATSEALPLTAAPAAEPSSAPPVDAAPSIAAAPSVAAKRLARAGARPMKLASLARKKAANSEIERPAVAALDVVPPAADAVPFATSPPIDAVTPMRGTDNTNRR